MEENKVLAIKIPGHGTKWMWSDFLERGHGAIMPTPTHDMDTLGMGTSYAHLTRDGRIMRFREQIGTRDDITILTGEDDG